MPLAGIRCKFTAMLMADCRPNSIARPAAAKRDERVLVAHGVAQRAQHDEGEQRDQHQAEHDAEFLGRDREDEVGVAVGQDALDGALARAAAEPAAAHEAIRAPCRSGRCRRRTGSRKRSMRARHVREQRDRRRRGRPRRRRRARRPRSGAGRPGRTARPRPARPAWSGRSRAAARAPVTATKQQGERDRVRRHVRPPRRFAEQPGDQDRRRRA